MKFFRLCSFAMIISLSPLHGAESKQKSMNELRRTAILAIINKPKSSAAKAGDDVQYFADLTENNKAYVEDDIDFIINSIAQKFDIEPYVAKNALGKLCSNRASVETADGYLTFDQNNMTLEQTHYGARSKVEGYWGKPYWVSDKYWDSKLNYPQPKKHFAAWPGKEAFLKKLFAIESKAKAENVKALKNGTDSTWRIEFVRYRGPADSRFEKKQFIDTEYGSGEYVDRTTNIRWTDAMGPYYIEKFNVKPSKEFYDFIMGLELES